MAACFVCNPQDTLIINVSQLPRFKKNERQEISKQVALHLRRLIQQVGNGRLVSIKIPSAMELAEFYHCTPLDVLDGLYTFKTQEYDYAMQGLDAEIILCGPLVGIKPDNIRPEWMFPWECTHKLAENPLTQVLPNKAE